MSVVVIGSVNKPVCTGGVLCRFGVLGSTVGAFSSLGINDNISADAALTIAE
jgi:hypothetical protein